MSFSKLKKLCSIALIPRILRDEISLSPGKLGKRPLDGLWKMAKSTDSKDQQLECEKCKQLIEMLFGPEKPDSVLKQAQANTEHMHMDAMQKVIPPSIAVNEKSNETEKLGTANISPIESTKEELEEEEKESIKDIEELSTKKEEDILPVDNVLKSTTVKAHEEQLAQKMETIEEPGLVEAATPKIDGFNVPPKVLGSQENIFDNHSSLCTKIAPEVNALDEIAKKCLSSRRDKIDEHILEEMKNCGMLGSGKNKSSKRSGYYNIKSHEKETGLETKKEQSTLYFKNQQMPSSLYDDPPMRYDSTKFAHRPQNVYPACFKNVPMGLIGSGSLDKKTDGQKSVALEHKVEKFTQNDDNNILVVDNTKLINADNSIIDSSMQKNPSVHDKIDTLEEKTKETTANKEENPKGIIENVELKLREIRVTAPEISRLPGETECDPDFDSKNIKPDYLSWNQTLHINAKFMEQKNLFETGKNKNVFFSDVNDPPELHDWYKRDQPFNNPNTAISGTYPQPQGDEHAAEREALADTAISARQDPGEYFDLSHIKTYEVNDDNVINLSTARSLAAYHQYTIITGTDETEDTQHVLMSSTNTTRLSLRELENSHEVEKQEFPKTINTDISATTGPVPQLKDVEEEMPLTEMLRRVRERNRVEYCRQSNKILAAEPAEANKCPPPLDKGDGKTLGPGPCRPKPKPSCPPPPPSPPPPCKPKDPCAKFSKAFLMGDKIKEIFSLVLHVAFRPASNAYKNKMNAIEPLKLVVYKDDVHRADKLGSFLLSSCTEGKKEEYGNEVILARDYEPWSPIPSWPIPKKEKMEPFVCPKEGCKIYPPPRLNPPCKENPCKDLPKRSFSFLDGENEPFYLYNTDHY